MICKSKYCGYICTLEAGHEGQHEAWGLINGLICSWTDHMEKTIQDTFFMVYIPSLGGSKVTYETLELAQAEAMRLAEKEGKEAFVLKCVGKCVQETKWKGIE